MSRIASLAVEVGADIRPLRNEMAKGAQAVRGFSETARRASRGYSTEITQANKSSRNFALGVQNAAFQVGDFAVQVGGGTSAVRAMSQQLPQLLGGFGVFGAVAGAAVAIVGPLAQSLLDTGDNADEAAEKLDGLSGALGSMRGQISGLSQLQETLNDLHRAQAGASFAGASAVIANSQKEYDARRELVEVELTLLKLRSQDQQQALRNLRDQQSIARENMLENLRNVGPGATGTRADDAAGYAGGGPSAADILSSVDSGALEAMRSRSTQIKKLEAELKLVEIAADEASAALDGTLVTPEDLLGGGEGGQKSRTQTLKEELTRQQEAISEHMQRLTDLTEGGLSDQLGAWGNYFDHLIRASGSSNERLLNAAKAFGSAQALVNAWEAHNEVLADPMLPWWMRTAAAAQVLATGLGAVSAIKGVTAGGGGGSSSAATAGGTTASAASEPASVLRGDINIYARDGLSSNLMRAIFADADAYAADGGIANVNIRSGLA
ncbi:hypothetical protein [Dinoroseobacter sp. S124A]|uniref:hypothetical protein n=1 Tax=Dinoroseobacter sp. S124A TaxID=3415128 RepID=UPI003C799F2F